MKKVLYVDCCIRGEESRTKKIADAFFANLSNQYEVKHLDLKNENLKPLVNDFFDEREKLIAEHNLTHPRFRYAHELADVDMVVIAAPFYDLSFPSLLKIYIENCTVDGITFASTSTGLKGLCKATNMYYFTSRGGFYHDAADEQATPYLKHLCNFLGIDHFDCIDADGMDVVDFDSEASLKEACDKASKLAKTL